MPSPYLLITNWALHFYVCLCVLSPPCYTMPCAIMALATFMKPATFAPFT